MDPLGRACRGSLALLLCLVPTAAWATASTEVAASVGPADSLAATDPAEGSGLAPSSQPAWNPPAPQAEAQPWEQALRLPGRILSLPLYAIGKGARSGLLVVETTSLVPRTRAFLAHLPRVGVYVTPASLGDRTGLGGALELRPAFLGRRLGAEFSGSTRNYGRVHVDLTAGPLTVDFLSEWRPEDQFFGLGPDSREEDRSEYAAQQTRARASLAYPPARAKGRPPRAQVSTWIGQRELATRGGRGRNPSFEERFPSLGADLLDRVSHHLNYGWSGYVDLRRGRPHWTHGLRAEAGVERFDRLEGRALAVWPSPRPGAQFTRYRAAIATGFSFMRDPRTIRLSARATHQEVSGGTPMQLADLSTLGGSRGLRGFEPGRFHDLDLLVGEIAYVFPLAQHVELEVHGELGNVYGDVLEDPTWRSLRTSYGVQLRPRTPLAPLGMLGVDWSRETVRLRYSIGGVE